MPIYIHEIIPVWRSLIEKVKELNRLPEVMAIDRHPLINIRLHLIQYLFDIQVLVFLRYIMQNQVTGK